MSTESLSSGPNQDPLAGIDPSVLDIMAQMDAKMAVSNEALDEARAVVDEAGPHAVAEDERRLSEIVGGVEQGFWNILIEPNDAVAEAADIIDRANRTVLLEAAIQAMGVLASQMPGLLDEPEARRQRELHDRLAKFRQSRRSPFLGLKATGRGGIINRRSGFKARMERNGENPAAGEPEA